MDDFPKLLIVLGISIALVGVIWRGASRLFRADSFGTLEFQVGPMTRIVPVAALILFSALLTIALNLILRGMNK